LLVRGNQSFLFERESIADESNSSLESRAHTEECGVQY
jgi:hypothetical protein